MLLDSQNCTFPKINQEFVRFDIYKGNIFTIPEDYVTKGTIGDLGIICGN